MADINCAKCREPWDAYGVRQAALHDEGDMEKEEAIRFLRGEGCPCCGFGGQCSSCDGTGREEHFGRAECTVCRDKGYVLAWSPKRTVRGFQGGQLYTGFHPNVRRLPESVHDEPVTMGVRRFPEKFDQHQTADGWVEDWWVQCPEGCATKEAEPCLSCDGKGTLATEGDADIDAARSELDWSDEDPMEILERRGLI